MKLKSFSIVMAMLFVLVGCQGYINDGENNDNNNNIEPTRNMGDNRDNQDSNLDMNRNENRGGFVDNRDNGRTNRNRNNISNIDNRNNEYDVSEEAAKKIEDEIAEIDQAYVLTTNNNAYVAAMMDTNDDNKKSDRKDRNNQQNNINTRADRDDNTSDAGNELTDEVKRKISDIVQSIDENIDNVYVTTNPDFADLTDNYMNQMNEGKPIKGFFDQIGNTIERVFPQNKR